jgi:hypothetical protein
MTGVDAITLGFRAGKLTVYLSRWGDFVAAMDRYAVDPDTGQATDDLLDWAPGTVIDLRFYPSKSAPEALVTWSAAIAGPNASWYTPKAQVISEVLDPNNSTARLIYLRDGVELEWEEGVTR